MSCPDISTRMCSGSSSFSWVIQAFLVEDTLILWYWSWYVSGGKSRLHPCIICRHQENVDFDPAVLDNDASFSIVLQNAYAPDSSCMTWNAGREGKRERSTIKHRKHWSILALLNNRSPLSIADRSALRHFAKITIAPNGWSMPFTPSWPWSTACLPLLDFPSAAAPVRALLDISS